MQLDRDWIERHIPHQGAMCLLDGVAEWDSTWIRCRSGTHRSLDNPLRAHGRLGGACGIEYASQAIAVHGALLAPGRGEPPRVGYLGSVRAVSIHVARLDQVETDLIATAERVSGDAHVTLYRFNVQGDERLLLSGQIMVILDGAALRAAVGRITR